MTCYSIRLLKITPEKADHVVTALRRDGLFAELKKQIPGHIGCSILESDLTNDLYLVIDFWQSKDDFFQSEISPSGISLTSVLDRLAYEHSTLGSFSFPFLAEVDALGILSRRLGSHHKRATRAKVWSSCFAELSEARTIGAALENPRTCRS